MKKAGKTLLLIYVYTGDPPATAMGVTGGPVIIKYQKKWRRNDSYKVVKSC